MTTTRRTLIKGIPALVMAPEMTHAFTVEPTPETNDGRTPAHRRVEFLNLFGPDQGGVIRVGRGVEAHPVYRNWGISRDIDGSWFVDVSARPSTNDDWDHGGSINVTDSKIAAFLEEIHKLMTDPDAYGRVTI